MTALSEMRTVDAKKGLSTTADDTWRDVYAAKAGKAIQIYREAELPALSSRSGNVTAPQPMPATMPERDHLTAC